MEENRKYTYIILTAAIASFSVAFAGNSISVALPTLASAFHISNIMQNWIITIYLLVLSALGVPLAKICGKHGLNYTFRLGLLIFAAGSIIATLSFDLLSILIARVVQAVGASMVFVTNTSIITAEIPQNNRGRALGINVTGVYLGLTTSPTISGIIVHNLSWRFVFLITVPLVLVAYYLIRKIDKEWIMLDEALDKIGSVIYIAGIVALLYGFTTLNTTIGMILSVVGFVLLIVFVIYELRVDNPVYEMKLFKNINYTTANLVALIAYLSTYVVTYVLNYHFQYIMGLDAQSTGMILIATPVMMLLVAAQAGKLSDRINPSILQLSGVILITIALSMLSRISYDTPVYMIVVAMIIQGLGHGLFSTPNNNIILSSVDDKKDIPTASASVATVRNLGQTFSLGILTVIFAFIMGNVAINPSNYDLLVISNQSTLTITSILCVGAVILSAVGLVNSRKD